jgi:hypothetical protein
MPRLLMKNDNVEIEEESELNLEDWKLPLSIEDEEALPGDKSLEDVLEDGRGARGEPALYCAI